MRNITNDSSYSPIGLVILCFIVIFHSEVFAESNLTTIGNYIYDSAWEDDKTLIRHGNWFGPGWWGGSEHDDRVGMLPPVDSLDAVAQRHDFGYLIAEKLGKGRPDIEAKYKAIADAIAAREAFVLSDDPSKWPKPADNPELAKTYLMRIRFGFPHLQQKINEFKASIPNRADITDPEVLNQMLKGYPEQKEFEAMMVAEVKKWEKQYKKHEARKKANKAARVTKNESQILSQVGNVNVKDSKNRREKIMENLTALSHDKIQIAFNGLKINPPDNFYNCLCRQAGYGSSSAAQYYHPGTIGKPDKRYACSQPGEPCVVSGYGCLRYPLPSNSEIWESCMKTNRVNTTKTEDGKVDPDSGEQLDVYIEKKLAERIKEH
jgi:hypothetical protein